MTYCTVEKLSEFVLEAYLDAAEETITDIQENSVDTISAEIDDLLRPKFKLPIAIVPGTLERIAAVLAAYRVIGAVTSLLNEAEFMYIRDMATQARKDLDLIRTGKMDLGLEVLGEEPVAPGNILVSTPDKTFNDDLWSKF